MAIALVGARTSNFSTTSTTLTASLTAAQTGNFSLLFIGFQPQGNQLPTVSVTDTSSNTWTLLSSYSAPATTTSNVTTGGIISQIFYSNTAASASSVTITMTFSVSTRKVYQLLTFSGTNGATNATIDTVRYPTMGDGTQALSSTRTVDSGDLIIANHIGRGLAGTLTATSTTTNGTWVPSNTTFYMQHNTAAVNSGILNSIAYKIATGTGSQTVDESWVQSASAGLISLLQVVKILQASFSTITATATGSGVGTATAATKVTQLRLNVHTDFSFGFTGGAGRFYIGAPTIARTATGTGAGSASSTSILVSIRTATGTGTGSSNNAIVHGLLRTGYGSGGATTGDNATRLLTAIRSGTPSAGTGSSAISQVLTNIRTATGFSTSSSSTVFLHVVIRTSTGSGQGTSSGTAFVTAIRTATGSGTGTQTAVGARIHFRSATGISNGSAGVVLWVKSFIFRPPADGRFRWAEYGDHTAAGRLFGRVSHGVSASNIYKLTDGTYTNIDTKDYTIVSKVYHGGHDNFVTAEEKADLIAAGYGDYVT